MSDTSAAASRIGVFVCHCGHNIAGRVRIADVVGAASAWPSVVVARDYTYMCSEPGQRLLRDTIVEHELDALVVAACSPRLHERTFRVAAAAAGLNPFRVEIANIREQCSWIHTDEDVATAKALRIVRAAVEKARLDQALEELRFPVTSAALVVGAGIAGIQAALDIAETGKKVFLVERSATIGGNMARLSETFPTLDCASCTLTPKMVEASQHPDIELLTSAEVDSVQGHVGQFEVTIRQRARYVDHHACTGCGDCIQRCPSRKHASVFERGMGKRPAISTPFPQAIPNKPTIDRDACLWFGRRARSGKRRCGLCAEVCQLDAIRFDDQDSTRVVQVGAIVLATGFDTYGVESLPEYGGGQLPDVIDSLQFERLMSASGPTAGRILRPSDGREVQSVAFVHCAGSRDALHHRHCSKVCCLYTSKHAMLFRERVPHGTAWAFYIDLRHGGRDAEEFLVRTQQAGVRMVRGKVSGVVPGTDEDEGKLVARAEDTLTGELLQVPVDLVVLATSMLPAPGTRELAQKLKVPLTPEGFLAEAHIKLRPAESATAGIFLAGTAQGPRDIPESVAQGSAAAAKVLGMLFRDELSADPTVAWVLDPDCVGCSHCVDACPSGARTLHELGGVLAVDAALCLCCGACSPACPTGAAQMLNFSDDQLISMLDCVLATDEGVRP